MAGVDDVETLVRRFYDEVWNRWDDAAVDEVLAVDFLFRGSLGDEARGRDGFRAYRDRVRLAFPDFHNELRDLLVDGGRAAVRLACSGRHSGEVLGLPPTGSRIAYEAAAFFNADGGQLASAWVIGDLDRLRRQLTDGDG